MSKEKPARVFFAINVTEEITATIAKVIKQLKKLPGASNAKWVKPEKQHITLRFMAEITNKQVKDLIPRVETAIKNFKPFLLHLGQLNMLPSVRNPRVIVIDILSLTTIVSLALLIDREVVACDLPKDKRPLRPHLTIGRLRGCFAIDFDKIEIPSVQFLVSSVKLYKSELSSDGSIYTELSSFGLSNDVL